MKLFVQFKNAQILIKDVQEIFSNEQRQEIKQSFLESLGTRAKEVEIMIFEDECVSCCKTFEYCKCQEKYS